MSYYGITQSRATYQAPLGARSSSAPSYERTPLSRSGSHTNVYLRGSSTAPTANASSYYNSATNFESRSSSRSSTPGMNPYDSQQWSRSPSRGADSRPESRSRSPIPSYTDALIKASRQLRERSIPKTEQGSELPKSYHATSASRRRYASGIGKPPLPPSSSAASYSSSGARVVASDFYRGKVKSIYEREPLFHDFAVNLRLEEGKISLYNAGSLDQIKKDFYHMVEDKWTRKGFKDPSVEHDLGRKLYPWQNVVGRGAELAEPASVRISRIQNSRSRMVTPPPLPKIRLYHQSTLQN